MKIHRIHFTTIDSTNTWAKQHAHEFDPQAMTLVTAGGQTAGRGRFNRQWVSPQGQNIYATYCVFLEKHRPDIGNLPQVAAISIVETLTDFLVNAHLKWPNDVVVGNKKIAGILSESTPLSDKLCLIIGIGLNVNMSLRELDQIDRPATSMLEAAGNPFEVETVLECLTKRLKSHSEVFLEESFVPFLETYRRLLNPLSGKLLRFHDNRSIHEGYYHSINADGTLNLQLPDQTIQTFNAGEFLP